MNLSDVLKRRRKTRPFLEILLLIFTSLTANSISGNDRSPEFNLAVSKEINFAKTTYSQKDRIIEISFEFVRNQIFLPVYLKEKKFYMLLDTAVAPSAIDLTIAKKLGFALETDNASQSAGRGNNPVAVYPTKFTNLRLGGKGLNDIEAVAVDLSHLSKKIGRPIHGILGYSFFNDRIVQIDYPSRKVRLLQVPIKINTQNKCVETSQIPLEFVPNDTAPLIKIMVNGQSVSVSVDTGSSLTLELFPEAVKQLELEQVLKEAQKGTIRGANGEAEVYTTRLDSISFGDFVLKRPLVTFADPKYLTDVRRGNLGNGFLQNFVLTFDYKNKKITLQNRRSLASCSSTIN